MAYTTIIFKNPQTGEMKEAPVGYSWTLLFFGFFVPVVRNDWKWFIIILLLAFLTWGLSNVLLSFMYNQLYVKDLIGKGYKAVSIACGDMNYASVKIGRQIPMLEGS